MFRTVEERDGYLPIEDHGLIGDGSTAALVGRDGSIDWLCVPRFDSEPLFYAVLDRERGGTFAIRPEGLAEARQAYDGETGILVTELRQVDGSRLIVTDALIFHAGADLTEDRAAARGELLRSVRAVGGTARRRIRRANVCRNAPLRHPPTESRVVAERESAARWFAHRCGTRGG